MELTSNLISQFVKVTNDRNTKEKEISVYGSIVNDGGQNYVKLDVPRNSPQLRLRLK